MTETVELVGETAAEVRVPGGFPVVERRVGFECSSGEWIEREYRGVELERVLAAVSLPDETTHFRVTAGDGHVACPAVTDALAGILATGRDGAPRFVAPGIAGPRAIKRVQRVEALALDPGEDPDEFEEIPPDARE